MGVLAHIFIISGDNGVKMVILERVALDIVRKIYLSVELYIKVRKPVIWVSKLNIRYCRRGYFLFLLSHIRATVLYVMDIVLILYSSNIKVCIFNIPSNI